MTKLKKILIVGAVVLSLGATTITAFATQDVDNNIISNTADITQEEQLQEYKDKMLEYKKSILDQRVKDGVMTQEEANEILKAIEENQAFCDGTGSGLGRGMGRGFGQGGCRGKGLGYREFSNSNYKLTK